uniref:[histone H3]-lysine(4) N-trimethyltransferase n=1 Tax=Knipowitschia caucasica TaxID=637954 RepID=A0AAV2IWW0_KNICA
MENAQLFDAGDKGRGLRATKELSAGDVVFAEPGYAAVVYNSMAANVCHNCFRRQSKLHRCAQCRFAHYCDRTCQTACWEEHKLECAAIRKIVMAPNEQVRLAGRVMWRIHKDTPIATDTQLVAVDKLEDHVADLGEQLKADVSSFFKYWSYFSKQHSAEYIAHILAIIKCNGFALSDQRGQQTVGVGLFPNLCLVNHDCWPNCTVILNNGNQSALNSALHSKRRIELRALGTISEGQELTVSYVDFLNLSADRQKKLKDVHFFDCTCEHCTQHIKDDLMTAAAEVKPSADKVKEVSVLSKENLEKIVVARNQGNFHEVAQLCSETLEKQENVLANTNLLKLRALSMASEALSYLRVYSEAANYARMLVEGYSQLYHPNSAPLGLAIMKAGVTHWHAGQIEQGHSFICKAYSILMITHGPNHAVTRDLETMRAQTEIELKMFKQKENEFHTMRQEVLKDDSKADKMI